MAWKKGQSGNPTGPKRRAEVGDRLEYTKLLRKATPTAIASLVAALDSEDAVAAAKVILAYSMGKPPDVPFSIAEVPDDVFWHEAKRRHEQLEREREEKNARRPLSS